MLTEKEKIEIKEAVEKKLHDLTCPMCKNKNFTMADGYFFNSMQTDANSINLGGQAIPTIGLICSNCGFVSQHALGVLGILDKLKKNKQDEPAK